MARSRQHNKRNARGEFTAAPPKIPTAPTAAPFLANGSSSGPLPAARLIHELKASAQKNIPEDAVVRTNYSLQHYEREISRFEVALQKTVNPVRLWMRRRERRALQHHYGIIDWTA